MKKKLFLNLDENTMNQSISCEFGPDGVRFVRSGIKVTKEGMSKVSGSQIMPLSVVRAEDIEFGAFIGRGATGYVQEGIYKPTNFPIAIKTINAFDKGKRHQAMNDLKVYLSDIYSKGKTSLDEEMLRYLVHLYGAYYDEGSLKIILELMDVGSLRDILNMVLKLKSGPPYIEEPYLANIAYQILMGLNYLHGKKHQIHRDIKPENILMNSLGQVKLTDFGISKELEKTIDVCRTFVGTMTFMSPERVEGKIYTYSSDIWSFGLMLIELVSGEFPFGKDKTFIEMIQAIRTSSEPTLPNNGLYSAELIDFIKLCLNRDPSKRATAYELLQHKWLYINSDLNKDLSEWITGVLFTTKYEKMGEEKKPLADKVLKNGKTTTENQNSEEEKKIEIESTGMNYSNNNMMDSNGSYGYQQEINYQPINQFGNGMAAMNNGMINEQSNYTNQNIKCDMEIESLE